MLYLAPLSTRTPLFNKPPLFRGWKLIGLPHLPIIILHLLINDDCKTLWGLIRDGYSPTGSSDLFLILVCMTSNFMLLRFSTLYSSPLWRTDTIVFAKLNKRPPPLSNSPSSLLSTPSNMFEINSLPGGKSKSEQNNTFVKRCLLERAPRRLFVC